ncbi:hypothetical protein SAMN05660880_02517 [Luteibacter sp. 22Crub2.1]|nr:hypothetical protein SAMN05660880_02517 [Luteibacter sp. 22Crub2.1]
MGHYTSKETVAVSYRHLEAALVGGIPRSMRQISRSHTFSSKIRIFVCITDKSLPTLAPHLMRRPLGRLTRESSVVERSKGLRFTGRIAACAMLSASIFTGVGRSASSTTADIAAYKDGYWVYLEDGAFHYREVADAATSAVEFRCRHPQGYLSGSNHRNCTVSSINVENHSASNDGSGLDEYDLVWITMRYETDQHPEGVFQSNYWGAHAVRSCPSGYAMWTAGTGIVPNRTVASRQYAR